MNLVTSTRLALWRLCIITRVDTSFIYKKKSNVAKCNGEMAQWRQKSIFDVKKRPNLSKKHFIEKYQYRTTFFVKYTLFNKMSPIFGDTVLSHHYRFKKKSFAMFYFL